MDDTDFIRSRDFAWFLKVMMAMADIRGQELADDIGVPTTTIYNLRAGQFEPTEFMIQKVCCSIERWKPGTIEMMKAAEEARKNYEAVRVFEKKV